METLSELVELIRADGADTNPHVAELCDRIVEVDERDERDNQVAARFKAIAALAAD